MASVGPCLMSTLCPDLGLTSWMAQNFHHSGAESKWKAQCQAFNSITLFKRLQKVGLIQSGIPSWVSCFFHWNNDEANTIKIYEILISPYHLRHRHRHQHHEHRRHRDSHYHSHDAYLRPCLILTLISPPSLHKAQQFLSVWLSFSCMVALHQFHNATFAQHDSWWLFPCETPVARLDHGSNNHCLSVREGNAQAPFPIMPKPRP